MRSGLSVSVVIPTHNRRELICQAVDSVLWQSVQAEEVIIVDDGSSDGTAEVLERRYGRRICVIRQPNRGVSAARNAGIRSAKGDLLAFVDSDDRWLPGKLEYQLPIMEDKRVVLSFASFAVIPNGAAWFDNTETHARKLIERPFSELCREDRPWIHLGACIMRRDAVMRVGMFNERMRIAEDTLLIYRLGFEGFFASIPDVLYEWNLGKDRTAPLTVAEDVDYLKTQTAAAIEILMETYARADELEMNETLMIRKKLGNLLAKQGLGFARDGLYSAARRRGLEALGFGAARRSALQGAAALLFPGIYARVAARRKRKRRL